MTYNYSMHWKSGLMFRSLVPPPGNNVPVPVPNDEDPGNPDNKEENPRLGLAGSVKPEELYPLRNAEDNPEYDASLLLETASVPAVTGTLIKTRIDINPIRTRLFFNSNTDFFFIRISRYIYVIGTFTDIIK